MSFGVRGTLTSGTATGAASVTNGATGFNDIPVGQGDLLLVGAFAYGGGGFAAVAGWTKVVQNGVTLFWKVAQGNETDFTATLSSGTDNLMVCGCALNSADGRFIDTVAGTSLAQGTASGSGSANTSFGTSSWPDADSPEGISVLLDGGHAAITGADAPFSYIFNPSGYSTIAFARVNSAGGWANPSSLYLMVKSGVNISLNNPNPAFTVHHQTNDDAFNTLGAWTQDYSLLNFGADVAPSYHADGGSSDAPAPLAQRHQSFHELPYVLNRGLLL